MKERLQPNPERSIVIPENIPSEIQAIPHWVTWRSEKRAGTKPAKAPYTPTGHHANIQDPHTWSSFDHVIESYQRNPATHGIGYVLTRSTPTVGIDLDSCLVDGQSSPFALKIINRLNSYTEISPSGTGLHILVNANLGGFTGTRRGKIELYNYSRYLTITGNIPAGAPTSIQPRQNELRELYREYLAPARRIERTAKNRPEEQETDEQILQRLFLGKLGSLYQAIWNGDISQVAGQDESRADTLLMNGLAFYTYGDHVQIHRLLLSSPRAMQRAQKWAKPVKGALTYLEYQIDDSVRYSGH